ncbi:hypothetical protein DFP72DRAFT_863004 [Ephemerocybe angulata]|uniref:Uncharacterized protein n=1 Tax=Ephemerocybe angulata TaxID=980116 RepID=A0A8H6H876_9AGAR|nr:hypothetical protein DFP72DRAFT_863004 [Tulosesus angulatus]
MRAAFQGYTGNSAQKKVYGKSLAYEIGLVSAVSSERWKGGFWREKHATGCPIGEERIVRDSEWGKATIGWGNYLLLKADECSRWMMWRCWRPWETRHTGGVEVVAYGWLSRAVKNWRIEQTLIHNEETLTRKIQYSSDQCRTTPIAIRLRFERTLDMAATLGVPTQTAPSPSTPTLPTPSLTANVLRLGRVLKPLERTLPPDRPELLRVAKVVIEV